ncbi:hypothetical protein niasHT_022965 [Heterodera trifolii]|uniref:LAS1-like protein n=1 Tax=Heterodera trifolii TaxID=157864 RepID=A0ABD2KP93_9BILA
MARLTNGVTSAQCVKNEECTHTHCGEGQRQQEGGEEEGTTLTAEGRTDDDEVVLVKTMKSATTTTITNISGSREKGEIKKNDDEKWLRGEYPIFTRVINYLNEVCQDAVQNVSIAAAVSKFAIPSWVVDLRHAATHGQMPPLDLMRQANLFIRRWLWRQYWALPFNEAIKENLSSETVEKQQEAFKAMTGHQLITVMNRFREWRRKFRNLDEFHPNVEGRPMKSVCMGIERLLEQCPDEFLLFFAKSCLAPSSVASSSTSNGGSSSSSPKKSNVQQQQHQIPAEEEADVENGCGDDANAVVANDFNDDEMPSSLFCIDEEDETLVATTTTATTSGINNNLSSMMSDGEIAEDGNGDDDDDNDDDNEVVVVVAGDDEGGGGGLPLFKCDGSTHLKFFSREKFIDEITVMEQNYYRPILVLINNKGCLQRLLVDLTRLVSQGEDGLEFGELRRLAGWANLLLHAYLETPDSVSTQNWRLILKHTVLSPQFFKDDLIDKLLGVLGDAISDRRREQLVHLLKIRRRQSAAVPSPPQQNGNNGTAGGVQTRQQKTMMPSSSSSTPLSMVGNNTNSSGSNKNDETNILDMSMQSVKSLSDLQERIRMEDLADSTFVRDPLTLEDAWSIAQPDELGPLGLTADQRPETLCLTLGEWGEEMRRGY